MGCSIDGIIGLIDGFIGGLMEESMDCLTVNE